MTVKKAREALRAAIDRCCRARGEAMWTQGYRTRFEATSTPTDELERGRLYLKEMAQMERCGVAEARMERLIAAFARAVRTDARAHPVAVRSRVRMSKRRTSRR